MSGPFRRSVDGDDDEIDLVTGTGGIGGAGPAQVGSARAAVAESYARIESDGSPSIWIELVERAAAERAAAGVDARLASGEALPLAGLTFAVKNNIDVAGVRTTAGCPSYGSIPEHHAPVVARLVAAGAVVVGVTNLDQFATGLVGTRSPHGVCPNAHWPDLISGGSSSGSGVAVARGHVDFSLGTDTAGSGRVPAAANGILGWKPTKSWVSTEGVVPACESLDCVSFFVRDLDVLDRVREVVAVASERVVPDGRRRLGVAADAALTFDGDDGWAAACRDAIDAVANGPGMAAVAVDVVQLLDTGRLLYEGAFVRERFDAVGDFIERHRDDVDPTVYSIIHAAGALRPEDLERDRAVVAERERALRPLWDDVDVVVLPTVPRVPTIDEVRAEPIAVNSMLGTYTNFVNLLGLCALTIPIGDEDLGAGPPASVSLIAPAGHDDVLLAIGSELHAAGVIRPTTPLPSAGQAVSGAKG